MSACGHAVNQRAGVLWTRSAMERIPRHLPQCGVSPEGRFDPKRCKKIVGRFMPWFFAKYFIAGLDGRIIPELSMVS
jgi:hypothetical protein